MVLMGLLGLSLMVLMHSQQIPLKMQIPTEMDLEITQREPMVMLVQVMQEIPVLTEEGVRTLTEMATPMLMPHGGHPTVLMHSLATL